MDAECIRFDVCAFFVNLCWDKAKGGVIVFQKIGDVLMFKGIDTSAIFSAAAIAALVSGFVTLIKSKQDNVVGNITKARAEWRDELKAALLELEERWEDGALTKQTQLTLSHIESLLNPYGKYREEIQFDSKNDSLGRIGKLPENEERYFIEDGHIWTAIRTLKEFPCAEHFETLKDFVQLLLKRDWEHSKAEVKPHRFWVVSVLTSLAGIACLAEVSPDSVAVGVMIFAISFCFMPMYESIVRENSKKRLKKAYLYVLLGFAALMFSIITGNSPTTNRGIYYIVSLVCFFAPIALTSLAMLYGSWGQNKQYIAALARREAAETQNIDAN